jgi:hypothetical protein
MVRAESEGLSRLRKYREIRASFNDGTIRVYQAYSLEIAESAVKNGTFVSPPFSMTRMTWIKPSFLWMMYRSGWGMNDQGQSRILAIDMTRAGFEWALEHSWLSHFDPAFHASHDEWRRGVDETCVRIQWDPERDIDLRPLDHRAIQIGLSGEAVQKYVSEWIVQLTDVTELAQTIHAAARGDGTLVERSLPVETAYPISDRLKRIIAASD